MTPSAAAADTTLLVVEDDPELQYLLSVVLAGEGRRVLLAPTAEAARGHLASGAVDLMVLDLVLPDADGRALLRALRSAPETASLPVVVLTSRVGKDVRAECYELGADAFVEKPFDPDGLSAEVAAHLTRAASRARTSLTDERTGLRNLAGLLHAVRTGQGGPRALLVVELDGLRALAARHGWDEAAAIEGQVAQALAARLGDHVLGRVGAGEFAVLMEEDGEDGVAASATELAEAAVVAVREARIRGHDGETLRLTASVGWCADGGAADPQAWLEEAQALAGRAAEKGGNRAVGPTSGPPGPGARPLVIVAEDDDITAKILSHRLEREGFEVMRFDNGQEAYLGAMGCTPALVILDVKMPGMDGFELLERLRRTPSYAAVPVMMLTSLGSEADVVRGFALGADEYIPKPFSPTELLARLRRLLRRERDGR